MKLWNILDLDVARQAMVLPLAGASAASVAGGPLAETFSELGLVVALMGAIGGALHGLQRFRSLTWSGVGHVAVSAIYGAALAFGLGALIPPILISVFGIRVDTGEGATGLISASAFLVGFMQERVVSYLRAAEADKSKKGGDDGPKV